MSILFLSTCTALQVPVLGRGGGSSYLLLLPPASLSPIPAAPAWGRKGVLHLLMGPSAIGTTPSRLHAALEGSSTEQRLPSTGGHGGVGTTGKSFEATLGGRGTTPGPAATTVGPPMAKLGLPQG